MKLWIDDLRHPPEGWDWAKTSAEAVGMIALSYSGFNEGYRVISFDHDLGGDDTSRRVMTWLSENMQYWPDIIKVHSMNPVGRDWLRGTIKHINQTAPTRMGGLPVHRNILDRVEMWRKNHPVGTPYTLTFNPEEGWRIEQREWLPGEETEYRTRNDSDWPLR